MNIRGKKTYPCTSRPKKPKYVSKRKPEYLNKIINLAYQYPRHKMSPTLFQHLPRYYAYRHIRKDTHLPFYVGIGTQNINSKPYKRSLDKRGRTSIWKNVVNKYGYYVEIFYESNNQSEIKKKEIEFIKLYGKIDSKCGVLVNIDDGGNNGRQPSQEEINCLIYRNKVNRYNKGKKFSSETRKKMSIAKNQTNSGLYSQKKPIIQCDKYGKVVAEFESISKAAKMLKKNKGSLSGCIRVRKQIDGYIFKYKELCH